MGGADQGEPGLVDQHFGTEFNLGNIAADEVIPLETLRLGLRADTVDRFPRGGPD